ncbi:MAG: hypothetical protein EG824_02070 [Deltaproteobacteria bacterium]|nr:hypothetical protein [Deltaproteobacteria bacterium]
MKAHDFIKYQRSFEGYKEKIARNIWGAYSLGRITTVELYENLIRNWDAEEGFYAKLRDILVSQYQVWMNRDLRNIILFDLWALVMMDFAVERYGDPEPTEIDEKRMLRLVRDIASFSARGKLNWVSQNKAA